MEIDSNNRSFTLEEISEELEPFPWEHYIVPVILASIFIVGILGKRSNMMFFIFSSY